MNRELPELVNYLELVRFHRTIAADRLSIDRPSVRYQIDPQGSPMVNLLPENTR